MCDGGEALTEAEENVAKSDNPIFRFVFTGGPCGGKTTALARVFSYLRERGFEVITCPEAYTTLSSNGMSVDFFSTEGMDLMIQHTVMDVQQAFEDGIYRVLKARGKPGVMLCDRGLMDGSVYIKDEVFQRMLTQRETDIVSVRDSRYDAIFHLVTAADGAESHYTLENNAVRTESTEEAIRVDQMTQKAWVGHPHLYCIDNSTDFEGKMTRLVDTISKIVGLPSNLKRLSAKFLLRSKPDLSKFAEDIHVEEFEVEKIYLRQANSNDDNYSFVRRRTNIRDGKRVGSVYQQTTAQWAGTELIEQKRIISEREYNAAYLTRDEGRHVVRQRRISFLYKQQSFCVHMFMSPHEGLCVLMAQVEACANGDEPEIVLPPFLDVERRITSSDEDKQKYGAYSLSIISE